VSDLLDIEIGKRSLCEMAPRMKVLAGAMPAYVRTLEEWQAKAREYGDRYIRPKALEIDLKCSRDARYFDWDLVKKSTPYGFLSMLVPEGAGGGGQLCTAFAIVMEELCAACSGVANIYGANGLGVSGILLGLDFYHFDRALAALADGDRRGEPVIFAAAITEPLAGSDVEDARYLAKASLMTEAREVPGGFVLNGRKVFISNGSVANFVTVIAPLDRRRPIETMSAFLVRRGAPGFGVGRVEEKMGMKACPAAELVFDDCFVPRESLIGLTGEGVRFTEVVLGASRGPVGAIATGVARGALERAFDFAKRKKAGGRRLIDRQWVRLALAEMARKVHVARQAYLDSCMAFDYTGIPRLMQTAVSKLVLDWIPQAARRTPALTSLFRSDAVQRRTLDQFEKLISPDDLRRIQVCSSMAKVTGSDVAMDVAGEALRIAGLDGALHANGLEKIFRDAKLTQIYEGTNQLNRHNVFINLFPAEDGYAD